MKNYKKNTNEKRTEINYKPLFTVGAMFIITLFLMNLVSAYEFDNVKSVVDIEEGDSYTLDKTLIPYNNLWEKYKPIEIKNTFGLGSTLFQGIITEHTETCGTDCHSNIKIYLANRDILIQDVRFYTIDDEKRTEQGIRSYQFYIKIGEEKIEVNDYQYVCTLTGKSYLNGTAEQICENKLTGTHTENKPLWEAYNIGQEVPAGTYEIKLEGQKKPSRKVDWQIKTNGIWTSDWAIWGIGLSECYQEYANVSTSCGGLSTGLYSEDGNWAGAVNNAYDGDWATLLQANTNGFVYINYTTPVGAMNTSFLETKMGNAGTISNTTIPTNCWNTTKLSFRVELVNAATSANATCLRNAGGWEQITYQSGTDNKFFEEAMIWNISTSSVTLNSPINNSTYISGLLIDFNCSAHTIGVNLTNISLWINSSGIFDIYQTQTKTGTINNSVFSFSSPSGKYIWTCEACDSDGDCGFADNRTINITNFLENSQTYNPTTTEGNTEYISINLTYNSDSFPNSIGYLIYNNTQYSSTKIGSGNNIIFNTSVVTPIVSANTNITFYWKIGLINATGTYYFNSTNHTQSVANIGIDDCSVYSGIVLNYTLKDEMTQANMNGSIELNVQVYDSSGSNLIMNISKSYSNYDNAKICINQSLLLSSSQYSLYAQAKYWNDSYVTRYNYIQNFVMTNTSIPQHINLFDLETTLATRFLTTYKGVTFIGVSGALISINKQYLAEDTYKTVEIEKTDQYGQVTGWFDVNGKFQIVVTKDGELLSTFDNIMVYCNSAVGDCKLNLDASSEFVSAIDYQTYGNFTFGESFNQATRTYTLNFATTDSSVVTMLINLIKFDGYGNTTLCTNTATTSSGSLTCVVPASNNVTFIAEVYKDGVQISGNLFSIIENEDLGDKWGNSIVVFLIGLFLTIPMMFIPSPIGVVLGTLISIGITLVLFIGMGSYGFATIFVGFVLAGGIIIWALRQRGAD